MKLNLLPKTVDTASRSKRAFVMGLGVFAASCVAAFFLANQSGEQLKRAQEAVETATPKYNAAVAVAKEADDMMAMPQLLQMIRNTALAKDMIAANGRYPELYSFVRPYIPSFFRITSLSATPNGAESATVNMTGTVRNAQEYADLMLTLLRIPGAVSVSRAGFQAEDMTVPALTEIDQKGKPRLPSRAPIPDDPLERLAYFESETTPSGYLNSGGFGNGFPEDGVTKTVRPGESLINVSVVVPKNIQTPNPRATIQSLQGSGGGGATPAATRPAGTPPSPAAPGRDI
ncbi:MAG TPA: hypothetical protein VK171_05155 [Fimbriimonas sp.]|nr:hypothetical protein [Fimbriimonas sp.]